MNERLEGEVGSSSGLDHRNDAGGGGEGVRVWNRGESALESCITAVASSIVVAVCYCVSVVGAVESFVTGTSPDVVLDEELSSVTGVDAIAHILVVVVEDVASTEAEGRTARVEVPEPVVVNGDSEGRILRAVAVRVANEHALPVVVKDAPGDGHVGRTVGNVAQTIIVVLVVVAIAGQVDVIDPNLACSLDTDSITSRGENLSDLEVPNDDVGDTDDTETDTGESDAGAGSIDGGVGSNFDDSVTSER